MAVTVTIQQGAQTTRDEFSNARDARMHLFQFAKRIRARREGNGFNGSLITGRGSRMQTVALYEIR